MSAFPINQKLSITLTNGQTYSGILKQYNQQRKCLKILNACEIPNGTPSNSVTFFYESEIASVVEAGAVAAADEERAVGARPSDGLLASKLKTRKRTAAAASDIPMDKLVAIANQIDDAVYIWQCDRKFHDAVEDIKRQHFIGLNIEGANFGRLMAASILSISTPERIYLFDLTLLGKVLPVMKEFLQSSLPRKIVHDSVYVADYLAHRENCQLNSIIDTMVAHFFIRNRKKKRSISLARCLRKYLNISIDKSEVDWNEHPLPKEKQMIAARNVAYLQQLHFHIVYDVVLSPLHEMTSNYSKTFLQNDDPTKIFHYISTNQNPGLSAVGVRRPNSRGEDTDQSA